MVSTRFFLQKVYAGKNLKKEKKGAILFEANRLTDLPSEDAKRRGGSSKRTRSGEGSRVAIERMCSSGEIYFIFLPVLVFSGW